jgi:hypothetical protein
MDCLRSFNVTLGAQGNQSPPDADFWTNGSQHFFLYRSFLTNSFVNIEGFKNINIYKIELNGDVYSNSVPAGVAAIVNDWHIQFTVNGQNSSFVGGSIIAGGLNLIEQAINPIFILSKHQRSISFESPIQSAKQLVINNLYAQGIGNESLLSVQLNWIVSFTIFYKYEGE